MENQELLAGTDKLTGLDNRRSFLGKSEKLLRYCLRKRQPAAMLILDLDLVKNLNDTSVSWSQQLSVMDVVLVIGLLKQDSSSVRWGKNFPGACLRPLSI